MYRNSKLILYLIMLKFIAEYDLWTQSSRVTSKIETSNLSEQISYLSNKKLRLIKILKLRAICLYSNLFLVLVFQKDQPDLICQIISNEFYWMKFIFLNIQKKISPKTHSNLKLEVTNLVNRSKNWRKLLIRTYCSKVICNLNRLEQMNVYRLRIFRR